MGTCLNMIVYICHVGDCVACMPVASGERSLILVHMYIYSIVEGSSSTINPENVRKTIPVPAQAHLYSLVLWQIALGWIATSAHFRVAPYA